MAKEHAIQKSIVTVLRMAGYIVFDLDVMSGLQYFSHKDPRRFAFIKHHKAMGYEKGQPDIEIVTPSDTFYVEIKSGKGKQSKEQKSVQEELERLNKTYLIWSSIDDAVEFINKQRISK